jgi:hypothetical protein
VHLLCLPVEDAGVDLDLTREEEVGICDYSFPLDGTCHEFVAVQHTVQTIVHLVDALPHSLELALQLHTA